MKKSISTRLALIVLITIFLSISVIAATSYFVTYIKVKEAAGVELYGCANITTGLLNTDEISRLTSLTKQETEIISQKLTWTSDHKPIFESQYILSIDGKLLVADQNYFNKGVSIGGTVPITEEIINHIIKEKHPTYSDVYNFAGMDRLTGYAPIFKDHDPSKEVVAISAIDFNANIIKDRTMEMVSITIIVATISLLITGLCIILFVRGTIRPLQQLTAYTKRIASGDLTQYDLNIKSIGEVQELAMYFKQMVVNLSQSLVSSSNVSRDLAAATEELSANTTEVMHSVEDVSKSFHQVSNATHTQSVNITKINQLMENIQKVTTRIMNQIEKTSSFSQSVITKSINGEQLINQSILEMEMIQSKTLALTNTMAELHVRTNKAEEILAIITNIAKQTNLLALNASIESARAGEYGKGFAVVAEKIRSLAEDTSRSASLVNGIINEIKDKSNDAVGLAKDGNTSVTHGKSSVKKASDAFHGIHTSIKDMNEQILSVLKSSRHINKEIMNSSKDFENIDSTSKQVSEQMQTVLTISEQQTASLEEINSAIQMLVGLASEMESEVSKFKL